MEREKVKIMIVEDSKVTRDLIKHLLSINPFVEIIATAENGVEALELIEKNRPDVVLTDIVMPKMDGFELTKRIMQQYPMPIIVMSGVYNAEEIKKSFSLFDAGAIAIMEKPKGIADEHFADTAKFIFETARVLSNIRGFTKKNEPEQKRVFASLNARLEKKNIPSGQVNAIAIGSSVGGPKALQSLLAPLPASLRQPIFIVQHIAPGFVKGFADWLNESISLEVKIPSQHEQALAGRVYIAPDKFNMEVDARGVIHLTEPTEQTLYTPSIGKLFQTVASSYGQNALGILLLGGEKDGQRALQQIKDGGGFTILESGERKSTGLALPADLSATIDEIAQALKGLVSA